MHDDPYRTTGTDEARDSPYADLLRERNAFYASLSIGAKEAFLNTLERAAREGLTHEDAWREAVIAAETAYDDAPQGWDLPPVKDERP